MHYHNAFYTSTVSTRMNFSTIGIKFVLVEFVISKLVEFSLHMYYSTSANFPYYVGPKIYLILYPSLGNLSSHPHCSRIARYPSFFSQDFFHFSSYIHNGDNLNMYKNLNFHLEFLKHFSEFYVLTCKIVAILRNRHKSLKNLQTILKLV